MQITFQHLPENTAQMQQTPQWALTTPWDGAALFVAALCTYRTDPKEACRMISALRGPGGPMSGMDVEFLRDRMAGKAEYLGTAYFQGATPENGYLPNFPYTVELSENPYSYENENIARIFLHTAGVDSPRPIEMRCKPSEGRWYLYRYEAVLTDLRKPTAKDPWA